MAYIDYYKVLGIGKTASEADIKKAYKKMARKYHPDLNQDNTEAHNRFQEINEANEVLSNPENRKKYDQHGENWKHADAYEAQKGQNAQRSQGGGQSYGGADFGEGFGGGDYSDFFEQMFGSAGGGRSRGGFRGQDYSYELRLSLRDVANTHKQVLNVGGKNIRITVPAGVADGQKIKLKGQGGAGSNAGPAGDLYITFVLEADPDFKRQGDDLFTTVVLDLYTAILGGSHTIQTLNGAVKLKIKPETQNGSKVRLKGKGFSVYKKEHTFGDLYVTYTVQIPTKLTEEQRTLFTTLRDLNNKEE